MDSLSVETENGRRWLVAYSGDRLARHLLHLEYVTKDEWLSGRSISRFDMDHPKLGVSVEVKVSNNNSPIQWFSNQLEKQLLELGFPTDPPPIEFPDSFPMDTGVYMVFSYRNRSSTNGEDGRRACLLKDSCLTLSHQEEFFANNVMTAYVIDIRLLSALRWHHGSHRCHEGWGKEPYRLAVNRTHLRKVAGDSRNVLEAVGFSNYIPDWLTVGENRIQSRIIETELDNRHMKFELVPLLPLDLRTRFIKQLNGSVKAVVP